MTVQSNIGFFLRAHQGWCEEQIAVEVAGGLSGLTWLRDDFVSLALEFISQPGAVPADLFLKMRLRASMLSRYSELADSLSPLSDSEKLLLNEFERFVQERVRQLSTTGWRIERPGARKPRQLAREIRRSLQLPFAEEQGIGFVCAEVITPWHLRTYLTADSKGFSYWHDIALEDSGRAVIRESYRSWFGLGWNTSLSKFKALEPEIAVEFFIDKIQRYRRFLMDLSSGDRAPRIAAK